ncbi:MAG: arylesterase [Bdellovibrionota bacterium]
MASFFQQSIAYSKTKIIFLGDSLTEGYGVAKEQAYPSLIEKQLTDANIKDLSIVNAGISGSTTAGGLSRLKWLLKGKPTHLVLALGANDGLRGLKIEESQKNLEKIILICQENKIKVMLAGMKVPPNYGQDYTKKFESIYETLAKKYNLKLMPFLLEGVAGEAKLNISDRIHPNAMGHKVIAQNLYKYIKEFIHE